MSKKGPLSQFMKNNFLHFNAAALMDAAEGYIHLMNSNGKMLITLAGAMSTAELGKSLAEMIRQDKVHAICCTGANLEEDIFNLVAHDHYKRVPHYRTLHAEEEMVLFDEGMNRVTDTCIPEAEAMKKVEQLMEEEWIKADQNNESHPPHRYLWNILKALEPAYQIDSRHSWVLAAYEKKLPIYTPGWEDSTLGNGLASECIKGKVKNHHVVESGIETMIRLAAWYKETMIEHPIGFFQIGGGIAGDFPICVVPMITQDLKETANLWSYFCQISDSTTSYGSYSGAVPNEKITWGKLGIETPKFIIESDATIVAPLIFSYVLGW
ncbi:MAG: deoxyhypusine synthase family protein [SAR324 cluster bacterium]|nr:deoxyhypusine synthase family protein [SAR324 cluster bacterium]